jgi:hypothetical protein
LGSGADPADVTLTAEQAAAVAANGHVPPVSTVEEWLLGKLIEALARFPGIGTHVGLLNPQVFSQHQGGIGILVVCDPGFRADVAELLEAMNCAWTAEHDLGVEAHLCGKLRPAPPVNVSAAATGHAACLAAAVLAGKRCAGPCGLVLPPESFGRWGKDRRSPYCPQCNRKRARRDHAARVAARRA